MEKQGAARARRPDKQLYTPPSRQRLAESAPRGGSCERRSAAGEERRSSRPHPAELLRAAGEARDAAAASAQPSSPHPSSYSALSAAAAASAASAAAAASAASAAAAAGAAKSGSAELEESFRSLRLEQLPSDLILEATLFVSNIPHSLPSHQVDVMLEAFAKAGATLKRISHTEYLAAFSNERQAEKALRISVNSLVRVQKLKDVMEVREREALAAEARQLHEHMAAPTRSVAVANRMIASSLGIRPPRRTEAKREPVVSKTRGDAWSSDEDDKS